MITAPRSATKNTTSDPMPAQAGMARSGEGGGVAADKRIEAEGTDEASENDDAEVCKRVGEGEHRDAGGDRDGGGARRGGHGARHAGDCVEDDGDRCGEQAERPAGGGRIKKQGERRHERQ